MQTDIPLTENKTKPREENYIDKNHLSNISEEKSDVHNISSIKSSKMIHYVKHSQLKCSICKQPQAEDHNEDLPVNNQNLLIYPCLCNNQAHRLCIKQLITLTGVTGCAVCKTDYAVGKAASSILRNVSHQHLTECLKKFGVFFLVESGLALLAVYVSSVADNNQETISYWKVILIVIFSVLVLLVIIYSIIMLVNNLRELNAYDIEIYCNQTEIAYHKPNSREVLKVYLDKIAAAEDADESIEVEIKTNKYDTDAATNMSLLARKKKLKEEIDNAVGDGGDGGDGGDIERNQTISRIIANESDNYVDNEEEKKVEAKPKQKGESLNFSSKSNTKKPKGSKDGTNSVNFVRNPITTNNEEIQNANATSLPKLHTKGKDNKSLTISSIQMGELKGEPSQSVVSKKSPKKVNVNKEPVEAVVMIQENNAPIQENEINVADKDTDEEKYDIEVELPDAEGSMHTLSKEKLQTSENQDVDKRVSAKDNSSVKKALNINAIPEPKIKNPSIVKT